MPVIDPFGPGPLPAPTAFATAALGPFRLSYTPTRDRDTIAGALELVVLGDSGAPVLGFITGTDTLMALLGRMDTTAEDAGIAVEEASLVDAAMPTLHEDPASRPVVPVRVVLELMLALLPNHGECNQIALHRHAVKTVIGPDGSMRELSVDVAVPAEGAGAGLDLDTEEGMQELTTDPDAEAMRFFRDCQRLALAGFTGTAAARDRGAA